MSTVLFAWELGGGLGHMMQMVPLARALVGRGHRVLVALRDLSAGDTVFAGTDVCYLQAPYAPPGPAGAAAHAVTGNFAHLLENVGWARERVLFALSCAWENLFAMVRPDVAVFDHSPTALLAARGLPLRKVVIGSGFCVPPDRTPWPPYRPLRDAEALRRLEADERRLLGRVNRLLQHWGKRPLDRLGELYAQVDETFLTTFEELEQAFVVHVVQASRLPAQQGSVVQASRLRGQQVRRDACTTITTITTIKYWGPVLPQGGELPRWPGEPKDEGRRRKAEGGDPDLSSSFILQPSSFPAKRVFAYLKRFEGLEPFVATLRESRRPTVLYVDGLTGPERERLQGPTLAVESRRLDLKRAAAECDAAVLHAGQGATAAVLLAGKPILQIPLVLEQRLTAEATARLGAGDIVNDRGKDPQAARAKLEALLVESKYANAARAFARKYETFDPAEQLGRMVGRVEELIESRRGGRGESRREGAGRVGVFAG